MSLTNDWTVRIVDIAVTISVTGQPNPYVLKVDPYQPSDVSSNDCPFFLLEDGGADLGLPVGDGAQRRQTVMNLMLCLNRREAETDLKYSVQTAKAWQDAIPAMFAQHVRLSDPARYIVSSTNTNPIVVTLATPHRYVDGDQATIVDHEVNTNANGTWSVTVVDAWSYSIPAIGNGVGGKTGTCRKTQPFDMQNIVDCYVKKQSIIAYDYGSSMFMALRTPIVVREFYTQPNMSA